jgi:ferredoxin
MPHLLIEGGPLGAAVEAHEPEGGRLLDICDDLAAPVPFSCRGASCGTCRVEVLEGAHLLSSPGDEECSVLELFGDPPGRRLACAAWVLRGEGRLRLRLVDD